jgi:hypothetical protein
MGTNVAVLWGRLFDPLFFSPPNFEKCGCRSELGMYMTFENHGYEHKAPIPGGRGFGANFNTHPTLIFFKPQF